MAKNQGQGDGLKHKIKSFLGLRKSKTIPAGGSEDKEAEQYIFTQDVLKELGKENNFNHRSRVLRELCEVVSTRKLEEHAVEAVWHEIQDMLQPPVPMEPRQAGLRFLTCLAAGQYKKLGLLRAQFLRFIMDHNVKEDLSYRIELLRVLTDSGRDVSYCEHIGPFLLVVTTQAFSGERPDDYLQLLINFVHYNSSFLDNEIITGIVAQTCEFCNRAKDEKEIEETRRFYLYPINKSKYMTGLYVKEHVNERFQSCLQLLDAVVRYGGLPSEGLYSLITTLCRTVNIEKFCQASWKLMKTLVGTRLGYSSIYIMCCILEDENNLTESILLRGAVFFIGMCVWGSKRVASLQHKPISLLPSFKQALHCNHPIVAHEIGLSLHRLVKKYGKDLKIVTWDIIFDLTDMLIKLQQTSSSSNDSLKTTVHDLLTSVEELYSAAKFDGESARLFAIVERCSAQRPEASLLTLLSYMNEQIHPAKDGWLEKLKFVMEKYFQKETRTNVRVKVLDMLSAILSSFRFWYEEELVELAVLPFLNDIDVEPDSNVRLVTAQLLVDLIVICSSTKCMDILAILHKLIDRPMTAKSDASKTSDDQSNDDEGHLQDIKIAVSGLVAAFKQKIFESPPCMAVKILEILVSHIGNHYDYGFMADTGSTVRHEVFRLFLSIRADSLHRIAVIDENVEDESLDTKYSVFLTCKTQRPQEQIATSASNQLRRKASLTRECPTHRAFDAVLNCLKDEWDWTVLQYVLRTLPEQLRNKTLIHGSNSDVTKLCAYLCKMVNDGMYMKKVKNFPTGSGRTELQNLVFPILAVLVTYHDAIEKPRQIELVKSLELGVNSNCSRLCVIYLTICTLEMKSIMLRILPSILLTLSKISATVPMSIPMLEFLSNLKEVPELYSNFVEDQYMSIFAIALPYTDAHRYSPYTVTLAHYVITAWFTRCRLTFRKGFVRLITKGLQSSALTKPSVSQAGSSDKQSSASKHASNIAETHEFHEDMTAVCSDMMAKYSFSTLSNQPKRSAVVEFLLKNGLSQSWLVGNTLVTVTTSGMSSEDCPTCAQKNVKVAAAKAAEKLRLMNLAESLRIQKERAFSEAPARNYSANLEISVKPVNRRNVDIADGTVEQKVEYPAPKKQQQDATQANSKLLKTAMSIEDPREHKADIDDTVECLEPLSVLQTKSGRVDSAVEMTEEASTPITLSDSPQASALKDMTASSFAAPALKDKATPQWSASAPEDKATAEGTASALEDKATPPEASSTLADKATSPVVASTLKDKATSPVVASTLKDKATSPVVASASKDKAASSENVSLVNRLALEQQQMFGEGQMFSPSEYLFSSNLVMDHGMSLTTSMETDMAGHELVEDSQAFRVSDMRSPILTERQTSKDKDGNRQQESVNCAKTDSEDLKNNTDSQVETTGPDTNDGESLLDDDIASAVDLGSIHRVEQEQNVPKLVKEPIEESIQRTSIDVHEKERSIDSSPNIESITTQDSLIKETSPDEGKLDHLKIQPAPLTNSQNSSTQVSPEISRRASLQTTPQQAPFQTSIELSSDYELVDPDDANSNKDAVSSQSNVANDSTSLPLCNCSCEGWAEILIRRPTGNTSWMMKIENVVAAESEIGKLGDVISLAASMESEENRDHVGRFFEPVGAGLPDSRPRFLSVISDEMSQERQSVRSSSDSPKPFSYDGSSDSSSTVRRRRFSTGSMDVPGTFWLNLPSPDPNTLKVDEGSENSYSQKWNFEKPSLGLSPKSNGSFGVMKRKGSFNSYADLKEKQGQPTMDVGSWKPYREEDPTNQTRAQKDISSHIEKTSHPRPKNPLKQSISSPPKAENPPTSSQSTASQPIESSAILRKEPPSVSRPIPQSTERATSVIIPPTARKDTLPTADAQERGQTGESQPPFRDQQLRKPEALKTGAQSFREKFSSFRPRGQTISTYPVSRKSPIDGKESTGQSENWLKSSLNPYFVFLQFFYSPFIRNSDCERPILLSSGEVIERSIKLLDRIPPYDHHKIGILYVGADQESNETAILANEFGSSRYIQFLSGLGSLICLPDCCPTETYTGGLDRNGSDGKFAYSWRDDISQVIFHAATLMPNKASDPACHSKKLHIGNNFVTIVYNDSRKSYNFGTIRGQFNFAEVLIKPLDYHSNVVVVRVKEDLGDVVTNTGPHVISDTNLPVLVRQLAIHTNMATVLHHSRKKSSDAYGCNWLERLKQIKRIRSKIVGDSLSSVKGAVSGFKNNGNFNSDFTDYT